MERTLRRDPRSFVAVRFSLVEGAPGTNLAREARSRLGFSPALGFNGVGGVHWRTEAGRAVAFTHPPEPHDPLAAMAMTLIGAKHSAQLVECVTKDALPASIESARKTLGRESRVSVWPSEHQRGERLPVVVEHVSGGGGYLPRCLLNSIFQWAPPVHDLAEAAVFDHAEEARDWLDRRETHEPVAIRYLAVAQAEQDQRDAALSP